MWTTGFHFLIGACVLFSTQLLLSQPVSAQDYYVAELMVESNVTLEGQTILTIMKNITGLQVVEGQTKHDVSIVQTDSVGECLVVGLETSCNCSEGYIWSNEVCYNYNCCRELTCNQNVSYLTPLCIPKVKINVNGTVTMHTSDYTETYNKILQTEFGKLNGYVGPLNVTSSGRTSTFEVEYSVAFETSKLQEIVDNLQSELAAYISVQTLGLVEIIAPSDIQCYESNPVLKCTFGEATDKAGWNMTTANERFELNDGTVVKLNHTCAITKSDSCVAVTLQNVTGPWEGTYECGFSKGLVRHTAKAYLAVARLPDSILVIADPITGDCFRKTSINIAVSATILKTNNSYIFSSGPSSSNISLKDDNGKTLTYTFTVQLSCTKVETPHIIYVCFTNTKGQTRNSSVTVPVIYEGEKFCNMDLSNGDTWPKTPAGDTAVSTKCPEGRVGYRARTCRSSVWDEVYDACVNEQLSKVSNAADSFLKGLGATENVALDIFSDLSNTSTAGGDNIADVSASLNILNVMAQASNNVQMTEKVLPALANAASGMLNKTWEGKVNQSLIHNMSANYLFSLESLVKNIAVNTSSNIIDYNTTNLDLKYCQGDECEVEVFGINISMKNPVGLVKTVAVKNLMHRLRNTFKSSENTDLLLSATMSNSYGPELSIEMQFPATAKEKHKPYCVFWDDKKKNWDDTGCKVVENASNYGSGIFCQCNHLTSFSVLMARDDVSDPVLEVITYVGLAISIVSLIIFLIIEYFVWSAVVKTKLSHYRHTCMVNIACFLLLANICFLASSDPDKLSQDMCLFFTICKHLFYLAKFSWMLCLSGMLVHQLIFVFNPLRKKVFMYFSSIVGYIFPILIVGSSYVYYKYTEKPYYNKDTCWLTYERLLVGSLHSFLLPIGTILFSNIFSMAVVIVTLLKSSQNDSSKKDEKDTAKSIIKVILILAPVFGVTWSIGFCLVLYSSTHKAYTFFNYTFTIVNSFQPFMASTQFNIHPPHISLSKHAPSSSSGGLFVLLTGFASEKKVKDELYKRFCKKGSSESTKNLTSTMYTKDK